MGPRTLDKISAERRERCVWSVINFEIESICSWHLEIDFEIVLVASILNDYLAVECLLEVDPKFNTYHIKCLWVDWSWQINRI